MPPTYNSASDLGADVGSGEEPPRKKLRTSHAVRRSTPVISGALN